MLDLGLFGSIYILSLFLGLVRGYSPLMIGEILMVTGVAQLTSAPVVAWWETRSRPQLLIGLGFGLFGAGLLANGFAGPPSSTVSASKYASQVIFRGLRVGLTRTLKGSGRR